MTHCTTPSRLLLFHPAILLSILTLTACAALGTAPRRAASTRSHVITKGQQAPQTTPPVSPVELTSQKGFHIDRRPVRAINMFNGNLSNPHGLQAKWASDDDTAIAWLKDRLDNGFKDGYTRFVLILPSGMDRSVDPATGIRITNMFSPSHWLPMSPQRRAKLGPFFKQWIAGHPGVTLGYYAGFDLDPAPEDVELTGHRQPNFDNTDDRQKMYDIMAPWVEQAGFSEIWWDHTSPPVRRDQAVQMSQWLWDNKGITAGGEAIPRVLPNYNGKLDDRYLRSMPWMGLTTYFRAFDPDQTWRVDPNTTEAFIGFHGGSKEVPTDLELLSAFQRGFIPWTYSERIEAHVMKLWKQANGDGISFGPTPTHSPPAHRQTRHRSRRQRNNSP